MTLRGEWPVPPVEPWTWGEAATVDGVSYPANWLESPTERWSRTVVLKGMPPRFRDELLVQSQTSATPHGWRVGEQVEEARVDPPLLEKARALFRRDEVELGAHFLTFAGETAQGALELFGCVAARTRMNPEYDSRGWVALGRLLAVSRFRGIGLGNHFNFHFFGCSQTLCGRPAIGCFLPTETEQTRKLCQRAMQHGFLDMVPMGKKRWRLIDRELEVDVFLAFYPGMRDWLLAEATQARRALPAASGLAAATEAIESAWRTGYDAVGGARLGALLREVEPELARAARAEPRLGLYQDFLGSARAMGTLEDGSAAR